MAIDITRIDPADADEGSGSLSSNQESLFTTGSAEQAQTGIGGGGDEFFVNDETVDISGTTTEAAGTQIVLLVDDEVRGVTTDVADTNRDGLNEFTFEDVELREDDTN